MKQQLVFAPRCPEITSVLPDCVATLAVIPGHRPGGPYLSSVVGVGPASRLLAMSPPCSLGQSAHPIVFPGSEQTFLPGASQHRPSRSYLCPEHPCPVSVSAVVGVGEGGCPGGQFSELVRWCPDLFLHVG